MPGLMDAHTHLTYGVAPGPFDLIGNLPLGRRGMRAFRREECKGRTGSGFTAVKDIGNDANYVAVDLGGPSSAAGCPGRPC